MDTFGSGLIAKIAESKARFAQQSAPKVEAAPESGADNQDAPAEKPKAVEANPPATEVKDTSSTDAPEKVGSEKEAPPATPEAEAEKTPETPSATEDAFEYISDFSIDAEGKEGEPPVDTVTGTDNGSDFFAKLSTELGAEKAFSSAADIKDYVEAAKKDVIKELIPGASDEIISMLKDGTLSLDEIATGNLYDLNDIPDRSILEDKYQALDMSEEEISELLEEMSPTQIKAEAMAYRREEDARRKKAMREISQAKQSTEAEREAQRLQAKENAKAERDALSTALDKELSGDFKIEMTGVVADDQDKKVLKQVVMSPALMRQLIYGTDTPSSAEHLRKALQSVAILAKAGTIAKQLRSKGANEMKRELIENASNISAPVGKEAVKPSSKSNGSIKSALEAARQSWS